MPYYRVTLALTGFRLAHLGTRDYVVRAEHEEDAGQRALALARRDLMTGRVVQVDEVDDDVTT